MAEKVKLVQYVKDGYQIKEAAALVKIGYQNAKLIIRQAKSGRSF